MKTYIIYICLISHHIIVLILVLARAIYIVGMYAYKSTKHIYIYVILVKDIILQGYNSVVYPL